MNKSVFFLFVIAILGQSCVEEFPLSLEKNVPRVVIQGMITDSVGPYFVQLTYSTNALSAYWHNDSTGNYNYYWDIFPIKNALVIMSNDIGLKDTLIPRPNHIGGFIDGEYQTTEIHGEVGRTYYLDVTIENITYHAESTMQECPKIDTVLCEFIKGDIGKEDGFVPIVYISTVKKTTSLLLKIGEDYDFIKPIVNNINIGTYSGVFPSRDINPTQTSIYYIYNQVATNRLGYDRFIRVFPNEKEYVLEVYSIDKQAFYFYKTALEQLQNDGGNFKVSPYTPLGNFSNGAIGLFQASAYNRFVFNNPYWNGFQWGVRAH